MATMYEILQSLPLFKGTSYEQISSFLEKTHVEFVKHVPGDVICEPGQPCTHIKYVLSGTVCVGLELNGGRAVLEQTLGAGSVFTPVHLFGLDTVYPSRVVSVDEGTIMLITKSQYFDILAKDPIFILNYINYLGYFAQKKLQVIRNIEGGSLKSWLNTLQSGLVDRHAISANLRTTKESLSTIVGVDKQNIDIQLKALADEGAVSYDSDLIINLFRKDIE